MYKPVFVLAVFTLAACGQPAEEATTPVATEAEAPEPAAQTAPEPMETDRLEAALDSQPDEVKARYRHRNPGETLEFFGIEPGMTVVEALPGGGWYSKILLPYLGADGELIGADYSLEMYRNFDFATDEFMEAKETWTTTWPADAEAWRDDDSAEVSAFVLGDLPEDMHGTADAVLFVRALHNLARFESDGGYLTDAFQDAYDVLRPGGIVGIVQHHARDNMPDEWANGENGYLKEDFVIQNMEDAGFEFVESSDINANSKDQPTDTDAVWRLPPSLGTSGEDPELRRTLQDVGESNRMTLKFRKPAG